MTAADTPRTLGPAEPIPLTVLTGFLGAGKTSLLNRLVADPALAETAVIINEFGEIGLDHLLVKPISDGVVLLQSGCLCCTLRGDLVDALEQLLRDLDNGRAVFRRVILETTGLADPAPVADGDGSPLSRDALPARRRDHRSRRRQRSGNVR
jgi:G3E family GTPase